MVDVNTQNKTISVNVSSSGVSSNVNASGDTTLYYSNKAKEWATSNRIVDGVDYSSKYYANKSNQSALNAQSYVEELETDYEEYSSSLEEHKENAIDEINEVILPVKENIETVEVVAENIETVKEIGNNLDNILNKTVTVGTVTTGEEGSNANVVNSGTKYNPILDFTIPRGNKGDDGGMTAEYDEETRTLDLYSETGTKLNPKWGNVTGNIDDQKDLSDALENKQDKGDYALVGDIPTLVSQLENDKDYATNSQVRQLISELPKFKVSIVDVLPREGKSMTLYLVSNYPNTSENNVYDEYIWVEQVIQDTIIGTYEFLGTTAVDLTDYVKNTDYATTSKVGLLKASQTYSFNVKAENGNAQGIVVSLANYPSKDNTAFICKGTLDNVLTQYSKTVSLTQADYDALETKDSNTLYLIIEEE